MWVDTLDGHISEYQKSVARAVRSYAQRVIASFKLSEEVGRRSVESWAMSVESECIVDVMHSVTGAYMSGKSQANRTLPERMPPSVAFRTDDMDNVNRLRDFNSDEIRKLSNDLRISMKLRTLERQTLENVIANVREDLEIVTPKVERLSNTEILRAANEGRIHEYDYRGVVEVRWIAKHPCCDRCRTLDGKTMFLHRVPPLPHHPNCRCTVEAIR
jgi:SPP1 gp7 family putative phage head morphogenesis protein